MDISEIIGLLPEDKRESVKTELSAYVPIRSKEDAERLAREHPHLKSAFDAGISRAVASHDERFVAEKLPGLVDSELAKRNPPKDPRDIELAKMRQDMEAMKRESVLKEQRALAVKLAAEKKIPLDLVDRFVGDTDEATKDSIERLSGALLPWAEQMANEIVKSRVGNNGTPPKGGSPDHKATLQKQYNELIQAGRREQANRVWLELSKL